MSTHAIPECWYSDLQKPKAKVALVPPVKKFRCDKCNAIINPACRDFNHLNEGRKPCPNRSFEEI